MNVNTMVEMIQPSQTTQTGSSSTSSTSSADNSGSNNEFESLLKDQVNGTSSSGSKENTTETEGATEGSTEGTVVVDKTEVTDAQRELMAALNMQVVTYRTVEVTPEGEEGALDPVEELVDPTLETNLLNNEGLNLADQGEADVSSDLGNLMGEEATVETEGAFVGNEAEFSLEIPEELVVETVEVLEDVEIPEVVTEAPVVEASVEIVEEAPELAEAVVAETVETVETETAQVETEVKVDAEADMDVDVEIETSVEGQGQQNTPLFQKVEAAPVKVAETVNTQDPDMDSQMAKIIQTAHDAGESTVTIKLNPEGLGTVTVQITQALDGALQVVLQAADDTATALLQNHVNQLSQALQGTTGQTVSVEVSDPEEAMEQGMDQENQGGHGQEKEEEREETEPIYSEDFMQQLRLGLNTFTLDV